MSVWISRVLAATPEPTITPGSAQGARAYYAQVSDLLHFTAVPGTTRLDDLLAFLGYPTTADKLRTLDPGVLMNPAQAAAGLSISVNGLSGATLREGDILATRFFAPKIVNINQTPLTIGWRKLVRLRSRPDSAAARAGVESAIILFNFFAPAGDNPFSNQSINTQVMLLAPTQPKGLLWLDFDPKNLLGLSLTASFDAADLGGTRDYFVPDGCNACHGSPGNSAAPMINYLDTDHWFDRLENDFAVLKSKNTALVFDAHTNDPTQGSFVAAFDVIRQFNEEALKENLSAQPNSFETEAARIWLGLHSQSDKHFPPIDRAFGNAKWQPSEADGLARLNQYCFRCHGSVRFSVFDRQAVVERAGIMRQRINPSQAQIEESSTFKMPPDRTLSSSEIQALDEFLKNLR
jgi:mono/diheme cytochrome c family protein